MKQLARFVVILLIASLLIGCSNNLGRGEARTAINKAVKIVPQPKELLINTGLVSGSCNDIYSTNYNPTNTTDYKALAKLGMVTIKPIANAWQVEFTEAGKRVVQGEPYGHTQKTNCDEWQSNLPVAVFDGIEVTGIQQEGIHAKADIAIKWKLTPLGLVLKTIPDGNDVEIGLGREFSSVPKGKGEFSQNDVAAFEKYDDGWRLKTHEQTTPLEEKTRDRTDGVDPKTERWKMVTVLERRTHVTTEAGLVRDGVEVGSTTAHPSIFEGGIPL